MDDTAFLRARKFLAYHPVAQWLAVAASILAALLFFSLILVLALFVDLVVNQGEVPPFLVLSAERRALFLAELPPADDPEAVASAGQAVSEILAALDVPRAALAGWFAGDPADNLPYRERALLWYVWSAAYLRDTVGAEAGERVIDGLRRHIRERRLETALAEPIRDVGLLSLAVRTSGTRSGWLFSRAAAWNPWTWASGNSAFLFGLFGLAVALAVLRLGTLFLSAQAAARAALEADARLRRAIFHHGHRLGSLALRAAGTHSVAHAAAHDVEVIHDGLFRWLTAYFREPVKVFLLLVLAFCVHFWLAFAFVLFAMLVWMVGSQTRTFLRRRSRVAQARAARELTLVEESMSLTRLVKSFLMEAFNQGRVERQLRAFTLLQTARLQNGAFYRPLLAMLGLAAALVLLLAAGFVVLDGHLGVTGAMVLVTAVICLYWPVRSMLEMRRTLRRAGAAAQNVFAFLDRTGTVGQAIEAEFLPALTKGIEFDKVTLQDPATGKMLLRGVNMTIEAGQRVALVGPDATEKQALVNLLPRFADPTAGEVRIDGKGLRWVTLDSLRIQIGMVLQPELVFNDTVAHNIGCGDSAYNLNRIIEAAKTAHAHQFIQKLPQGYETPIGDLGHHLDLGELFRIALARAILRDPAVYVIEEPEGPLDDDTKALIDDTLQRVLPGRTVLFLPHRLSTIRSCDRVFVLYQGRIAAAGDHRELLASSGLYKHLQYLQFNEFAGLRGSAASAAGENHE